MDQDLTQESGRVRKPARISKMTSAQKQELVKKAIEMAENGDYSGVVAMAAVEKLAVAGKKESDEK